MAAVLPIGCQSLYSALSYHTHYPQYECRDTGREQYATDADLRARRAMMSAPLENGLLAGNFRREFVEVALDIHLRLERQL